MPRSVERPPLSEAELEVLKVLWQTGPATAGRVRERIEAGGRAWAYNTTKTILDRLDEKGYVRRDRSSIPHQFAPRVSREEVASARGAEVRRELFDDADLPFVRTLLDSARLTASDIAELRAALDELVGTDDES